MMAQGYSGSHGTAEQESIDWSVERETIAQFANRHRWLVRFLALELVLFGLAGTVPLLATGGLANVVFGMVFSLAMLVGIVGVTVGVAVRAWKFARQRRSKHGI
ncbi:hypothetical protein [Haloarchaeobius sp. DFWS5]|uniref:hypothetical protein n=1 Tax=Haloarchaeobius sp. DFWS5 TaxID=3446114 RepID=UPI003EB91533